jgi:hypothetical protein
MDATRSRRCRDSARQHWYAYWRSLRFARHFGFSPPLAPARTGKTPSLWPPAMSAACLRAA